jgi:hypothetical protein
MKRILRLCGVGGLAAALAFGALWERNGAFGVNVVLQHGGTYWLSVGLDSPRLSPAMRRALDDTPEATAGAFAWNSIGEGFEVGELPVMVGDAEVDRILLARIDPQHFRFVLRNAPSGGKDLDRWMAELGAALVVNGSYYAPHGEPATPVISDGTRLGPAAYNAKAGAFIASSGFTGIRDLRDADWRTAFEGAENAMVSYPLLVADGTTHIAHPSRWLANRSFIGQDKAGRIIIGTTRDAFFSLDRLARFLLEAPLDLTIALNLDGGPVACQGIALGSFSRRTYGRWEAQVEGDRAELLTWPYGEAGEMPIVLAVLPRDE